MPITGDTSEDIWYCTRQDVMSSLDFKETSRNARQVDRAISAASRSVEGLTHRKFFPVNATQYFAWPNPNSRTSYRLWLDDQEIISIDSITANGEAVTDYFLESSPNGPPYDCIELDRASSAAFEVGTTPQRNIAVTGVFGYQINESDVATLATTINSSATSLDVNSGAYLGVGALIRLDSERMIVKSISFVDSTQNIQADLTAKNNSDQVSVTTGSSFAEGETILVDSEKMLITSVVGNTLLVTRAYDGSVLAAHTSGADVYVARRMGVSRAALGTTAASHTAGAIVKEFNYPGLIKQLAVAYAVENLVGAVSGYKKGDNNTQNTTGVAALERRVRSRYGRQMRGGAV